MLVLTHTKAHLTDNKTDTKFRPHTSTINSSSSMLPSSSLVAAGQHHSQHRCVPSSAGRQAPRMAPVMRFLNKHHEDPTGKQRFPLYVPAAQDAAGALQPRSRPPLAALQLRTC